MFGRREIAQAIVNGGLISGEFRFSSNTAAADPGNGRFRYNAGTYGATTQIFIDQNSDNGVDVSNFLSLITTGDRLYIQDKKNSDRWAIWNVTGPAVNNVGWFTIPVALDAGGTFLNNNDRCIFVWEIGGDTDALYLRLDATNDPLTGPLTTQQVDADTNQTRDLGTAGATGRFGQVRGRIANFAGESNASGGVTVPVAAITFGANPVGFAGGNVVQTGAGIATLRHGQGGGVNNPFKPVATIGNVFTSSAANASLVNDGGGSFLGGSTYAAGLGDTLLTSTAFGNFTWAYAYTAVNNPHTFRNGAGGGFLGGYSQGPATITVENFSQGQGCFTWVRPSGGNGSTVINVFNRGAGGFLQGRPAGLNNLTSRMEITTAGQGGFCQGFVTGAASMVVSANGAFAQGEANASDIIASGRGSFAHGTARIGNAITASGAGSFAIGDSTPGAITASAQNSAQIGPGVNTLADSFQIGGAGLRFKGTAGAPGLPQNGDFWVAAGFVYVRSNGATIQIAGPGPLTN